MTNNSADISMDRLRAIVAAYGTDPARWPDDERRDAEELVARFSEARAIVESAQPLDRLLGVVPVPASASQQLRMAILQDVVGLQENRKLTGPTLWARIFPILQDMLSISGGLRPAGAALAASLLLGLAFGGLVDPSSADEAAIDIVEMALLSDTFTGY